MTRLILASLIVISINPPSEIESLNSLPSEISMYSSSSSITEIELESSTMETVLPESSEVDITPNDKSDTILTDINEDILKKLDAIATNQQLYLFGYLPLFIAIFLIYIGCLWFYRMFIP